MRCSLLLIFLAPLSLQAFVIPTPTQSVTVVPKGTATPKGGAPSVIRISGLKGGGPLVIQLNDLAQGPATLNAYVNGTVVDRLFNGNAGPGTTITWDPSGKLASGQAFTLVLKDAAGKLSKKTFVYLR